MRRKKINIANMNNKRGVSMIVVLLILVIVSLLGVAAVQVSQMATKSARNERDIQIAWQAAEAVLLDAELDIIGKKAGDRSKVFTNNDTDISKFIEGCGSSGVSKGLCSYQENTLPAWLSVDFMATTTPKYVSFGEFTDRTFSAGAAGIQPAAAPRYIIEILDDPNIERTKSVEYRKYIYRVTAVGFGPNINTQVVLQTIYRN